MKRHAASSTCSALLLAMLTLPADAASLLVSIGVRETGNPGGLPIGADGGASNGIEIVNLDGQTLTADGTWQQFTFTPLTDPLTAFAGATANNVLDQDWGTLEMIRLANVADGFTQYRVWIDDVTNTISSGLVDFGNFELFAVGSEVMFQEPRFSGTTFGHLELTPNTSLVTDAFANGGSRSNQIDFDFVDDVAGESRWVRLTTFNTPNQPNPLVRLREQVVVGGPFEPTTISFWARAIAIPEPGAAFLTGTGALALVFAARRRARP
jgi:hypothetical protein